MAVMCGGREEGCTTEGAQGGQRRGEGVEGKGEGTQDDSTSGRSTTAAANPAAASATTADAAATTDVEMHVLPKHHAWNFHVHCAPLRIALQRATEWFDGGGVERIWVNVLPRVLWCRPTGPTPGPRLQLPM